MKILLFFILFPMMAVARESSYGWNIPAPASKIISEILFDSSEDSQCRLDIELKETVAKINTADRILIKCDSNISGPSHVREIKGPEMKFFGQPRDKWLELKGNIAEDLFARLRKKSWLSRETVFEKFEVAPIVWCDIPDEAPFQIFGCHESYYLSGKLMPNDSPQASLFCSRQTEPKDPSNLSVLIAHPGLDASIGMRRSLADLIDNEISFGMREVSQTEEIRCMFLEPAASSKF